MLTELLKSELQTVDEEVQIANVLFQLARQLEKDLGLEIDSINSEIGLSDVNIQIQEKVRNRLSELMSSSSALRAVLYKVDLPETLTGKYLKEKDLTELSFLLIQRELKKVITRLHFKNSSNS